MGAGVGVATGAGVVAGGGVSGAAGVTTGVATGFTTGFTAAVGVAVDAVFAAGVVAGFDAGFLIVAVDTVDLPGVVLAGIVGIAVMVSRGSTTVVAFAPGTVMLTRLESRAAAAVSRAADGSHEVTRRASAPTASTEVVANRVFTCFAPADEMPERRGDLPRPQKVPRTSVRDNRTSELVLRYRPGRGHRHGEADPPYWSMSAAPDTLFLEFQDALAGRYSLDRELGRGGMGIVYLAREVHLDRSVAIKLLPPERAAQPGLRDRFLREARLAAKLSHPNIIPIHSVEDREGFVFYVMAFVDGETLAQRVGARGPLSSTEGTRVLREVAWALAYAHAQGLVHRDVKPDNILLEGATNRVLVADFGIAAAFADASADGISGTPEFMSPEQVLGAPLDARSDLYGLGATAFYAFSGRFPFDGASVTEVLAKQVTEPAPPLASIGVVVPRKLAALVDRCLAKDPAHRPASAQSVAEQLGVAIEQRRELPVALRAFVRRNGRLDGGGTLVSAAVILPASLLISATAGLIAGFAAFFSGAVLFPIAYFTNAAYKLSLKGFAHQDLAPAYSTEMERAREELALERMLARPGLVERWLPSVARVSATIFGVTIAVTLVESVTGLRVLSWFFDYRDFDPPMIFRVLGGWTAIAGAIAMLSTVTSIALAQRRRDVDTEFWSRLWLGRAGKALFAFARKLMGKRVPVSAMTHRATELSLGLAAEQLFESLPKATRTAIGDVPAILKRLQDDAQALRRRYDDLQEALAAAGDVAESEGYADVRSARDEIHSRLGEAVGALETIRLNLLRLHAGSASVESLTTHLGIAAEVSEQVERLIAAHEEVDRSLRFPRTIQPTPV